MLERLRQSSNQASLASSLLKGKTPAQVEAFIAEVLPTLTDDQLRAALKPISAEVDKRWPRNSH